MSFARALFTVSSLTIVSRISGFVRDTLLAMFLGAGPVADAVFVAQRLPNLFRSLFAEGAFSAAFVPLYTNEQQKHGKAAAQKFAGKALAALLAVVIPFSILMMLCMPVVIRLLAPGFSDEPEKYALAVNFSLITFPYLLLISVTALQGGVLNAQDKFGAAAAAPISLNIVMILSLLAAAAFHFQIGYTLSWAFLFSGVVQMSWLAFSCYRAKLSIPLVMPRFNAETKLLFKRIAPGTIGAGAAQINMLLSTTLASVLPTGAVSCLAYADRLNQLPIGIVGIAVATTLLPILSRHVESGKDDNFRHYTSRAIEFCLLLGMPAAMGLGILAHPIVQTLFEHGAFGPDDTVITSQALSAYALGIPAFLLVKVFVAGYFARGDTGKPVKIAIVALIVNIGGALLLLGPLQHVGIALANTLALWSNATLLFLCYPHKRKRVADDKLLYRLPRLIACAAVMGVITYFIEQETASWFADRDVLKEIIGLGLAIGIPAACYAVLLQVTKAMSWTDLLATLRRRGKTENIAKSGPELTG